MDFSTSRSTFKRRSTNVNRLIKSEGGPVHDVLYLYPPTEDITLEQFEDYAITRQKLLREVSNLKEKYSHGDISRDDLSSQIHEKVRSILPATDRKGQERDHTSHYILRLAYCKSEEQRKWLLSQEVELLRSRLEKFPISFLHDLIEKHKQYLPFKEIKLSRRTELTDPNRDDLMLSEEVWYFYSLLEPSCKCYKVKFTQILDQVQRRTVVVKKGYAYFPMDNRSMLVSLICNKFRTLLSQDLVRTVTYMDVVEQDDRITPLLHKLKNQYFGNDFSDAASKLDDHIKLSQIDAFAKESFPPCMRHLHDSLRKEHHLKHFGRLQYGLFLKSIGMSLDEALAFWRDEFTKKMEVEKFEKQYAYNVRHTFGQEGKRANYTAYSCMKIITSNAPATGDHHGCPFRHWDHTHIEEKMLSYGIPHKQVSKITEYSQNSHYQLACQKYFEIVHALPQSSFSLEHPSQYYYESRKVRKGTIGNGGKQQQTGQAVNKASAAISNENMADEFDESMLAELTAAADEDIMDTTNP